MHRYIWGASGVPTGRARAGVWLWRVLSAAALDAEAAPWGSPTSWELGEAGLLGGRRERVAGSGHQAASSRRGASQLQGLPRLPEALPHSCQHQAEGL